ncbi:GNAT family N-acetyltransferase [Mesorhizobium waimense]|uniref:GNAT family N-acetyltransferase n=2 Tax=Mesorhizobium waimense TaxID=1300307 RepID=A0A3A5KN26_9HYPH|nr:GNAT family N-acetyltransferase [Mesorhizobium waimense]
MSGYFGTKLQQRLQAEAEASIDFIRTTPGACQTGRTTGCDDPDQFGWELIDKILNRDGIFGFRMIPPGKVDELRSRLAKRGYRFDTWDVFVADQASALVASEAIVGRGLPDGFVDREKPTEPDGEYTAHIQALMAVSGVVPFSGSLLAGTLGPATTVVVGDETGAVAATAHGYLPHNPYSAYHRYAWGGLVAVAQSHRGRGLGAYINARMILNVFRNLHATHIYELVSASNMPSRRMVESCGLRPDPAVVCGAAMPGESARFTH